MVQHFVSKNISKQKIENLRTPYLHLLDTSQAPCNLLVTTSRHQTETLQMLSRLQPDTLLTHNRDPSDTQQTSLRYSPNIRHAGPFLLVEFWCGLLLLLLWQGENKVNSYSNQLKVSWVCKLEWNLTKEQLYWAKQGLYE